MNRTGVVLVVSLAIIIGVATDAKAGKKLYVGNLPYSANGFAVVDSSTTPAATLLHVAVSMNDARVGTPQNPGSSLPASSSLSIVNPGSDGLGDAATLDVYYTGPSVDFPANSFFDVFVDITDPGTGQPAQMKNGVVKFFNEAKGFGFVANPDPPGGPGPSLSFDGEINPAQPGLSFRGVQTVPGTPGGLNGSGFFDIFTELQFDGSGPIDPSVPLFRITMTSSVPEPSSLILGAMGMVALIGVARTRRSRVSTIGSPSGLRGPCN